MSLLDCNMQLIHCAKPGTCLSDFFLVLWWVTLKQVRALCRGKAGTPNSISEVAKGEKACGKPHVAKDALPWITPCGTFALPTHVRPSASDLLRCAQFPVAPLPCEQPFYPSAGPTYTVGTATMRSALHLQLSIFTIFLPQHQRKVRRLSQITHCFGPVPTYLLQINT